MGRGMPARTRVLVRQCRQIPQGQLPVPCPAGVSLSRVSWSFSIKAKARGCGHRHKRDVDSGDWLTLSAGWTP